MQRALEQGVVLRDRYGNFVGDGVVRTSGDKWYFRKDIGRNFCEENSLEMGDFVIFNYKGVGGPKFRGKNEEVDKVHETFVVSQENDDSYVQEEESEEQDDDDDDDYVQEEEEEDEEVEGRSKSKSSLAVEKNSSEEERTFGIGSMPSKRRYEKKNIPDCYGADIFESGLALRPRNPFFVSRSRLWRRKNDLRRCCLVDEQGRKWETKMKQWKDGRLWCTRGWRSLCNVNGIGKDDTCICEFVQDQQGCNHVLHILVHLVHALDI
ncbi:UNVERIFIED_CONTAM: hypothetical protein Sangu_2847900 [Sesamum angustifolium]|uniref:TF-B3 domain-containing protein n=1 Tax=Sesamum angustifolium TaxID=2727405 RepID=A0AAW2IPK7_9LAMI